MQVLEQCETHDVEPTATLSIRKILLATDFSIVSEMAGAYAKALAQHFDAKLEIANVFNPSVVTEYEEAIVTMTSAQTREISNENLQRFAQDLNLGGIDTQFVLAEDHRASKGLLEIAQEHNADLIVMGTEAKSGLSRLILGSTAEEVLRNADCPVLTVGPNARKPAGGLFEFKKILFATDFTPGAAKAAAIAIGFAEQNAAHLYCCCVLTPSDEGLRTRDQLHDAFMKRLKKMIPEHAYDWCSPEFVVEYGEASESILKLARQVNADLIVLGARPASFWLTRVERGLTPALLARAKCPVLTLS